VTTSAVRLDSNHTPPRFRTPLYSAAAARSSAEALLAAVPLPRETQRVARPPSSAARELRRSRNTEDFAKEAIQTAFWVSGEQPRALLAFIKTHAPEGAREYSSGYGGTNGRTESWFEWLSVSLTTQLAGPRELFVEMAPAPRGHYAVRLDSVVAWHLRRPADSLIPASARWLQASVTKRTRDGTKPVRMTLRRVVTDAPLAVHAVAAAVNALSVAEPAGPEPSCPVEPVEAAPVLHLTFRAAASSPTLGTVVVEKDECGRGGEASAWVRIAPHPEVALTDHPALAFAREGTSLLDGVEAALGHRLGLGYAMSAPSRPSSGQSELSRPRPAVTPRRGRTPSALAIHRRSPWPKDPRRPCRGILAGRRPTVGRCHHRVG
jgi:hypothetical protein